MPIVPAVKVFQLFETTTPVAGVTLDACLIGPNYKVLDYLRVDDKQVAFAGAYDNAEFQTLQYPGRDPGDDVDTDSVKVFFDELQAEYFVGTDGVTETLKPTELQAGTAGFYFGDSVDKDGVSYPKSELLHSRGVKVGDTVEMSSGAVSHTARVLSLAAATVDASVAAPAADALNHESLPYVTPFTPFGDLVETTPPSGDITIGARGLYRSFALGANTYTITTSVGGVLGDLVLSVSDSGTDIPGAVLVPTVAGQTEYPVGSRGLVLVVDTTGVGPDTAGEWTVVGTPPTLSDGSIDKAGSFSTVEQFDIEYTITVQDGNSQGLNTVIVTTTNGVDNSGPTAVTNGVPFPVGNKGAQAVINLPTGAKLTPGDSWTMWARAGGHGPAESVGANDDTPLLQGAFLGQKDGELRLKCTTGGAFAAPAEFEWEIYDAGYTDLAGGFGEATRPLLGSGTFDTTGADENTEFLLAAGITITLTPDSGTGLFTASKVWEAALLSDSLELPEVDVSHDMLAETASLISLDAEADILNFQEPVATITVAPTTGTAVLSGRYLSAEDSTYTLTCPVTAGGLGTAILEIDDTGGDIGATAINTVAGVFEYSVGSRGLTLVLSQDFVCTTLLDIDFAATGSNDLTVTQGYAFKSPIVYTLEVTTGGDFSDPAIITYSSTGNVDSGTITTASGQTEYDLGTRGIKVTFDNDTTELILGQKWVVDTTSDTRFSGDKDYSYTLQVSRSGGFGVAEVSVISDKGDSSGPFVLQEDTDIRRPGHSLPFSVGSFGIKAKLVDGAQSANPDQDAFFHKGDKWVIEATAEAQQGLNKLILDRSIPVALRGVSGITYKLSFELQDVEIPPTGSTNWEVDETTITIWPGIKVTSPDVFDTVSGEPVLFKMAVKTGALMYVTYRALATAGAGTIESLTDVSQIEGQLGRISPENPLAYGMFKALENGVTAIKYLRIGSDDDIGYRAAIDVLENEDNVYALVPLTQDKTVIEQFKQHVDFMSDPDRCKWRIVIANRELDTISDIFVDRVDPISGDTVDLEATFTDDPDAEDLSPPIFTRMEDPLASFLSSGVKAGDIVLTDFVDGEATSSYPVDRVVSEDIIILFDGPSEAVLAPKKYEIVRPLTKDEQASAYAAIAETFLDRRVYLVWPDKVIVDDAEVDGFYLCCAIAGMVAGFPPHQGFTNLAMAGFDSVPRSTSYFTRAQLNIMAEAGVYIVTQKTEGGAVYARHQLSTDKTSVETQELSVTKNLDFLSFYFRNLLEPFIGVWNVTEGALFSIRDVLEGGIEFQKSRALPKIGAPLIDGVVDNVGSNSLLKDTVEVEMRVLLPFPLNFINLRLRVV
jgi:hypothetical protein